MGQVVTISSSEDYTLQNLGTLTVRDLNLDTGAEQGASLNDYVAFSITKGRVGRRQDPILTGPDGSSTSDNNQNIFYTITGLAGGGTLRSGGTFVILPNYVLPAPVRVSPSSLIIKLTGGVEMPSSGPGKVTVELRSVHSFVDRTLSITIVPFGASGAWGGVLLPYTNFVTLSVDSSGNIVGPLNSSDMSVADIYQYRARSGFGGLKSSTIRI
jgi:hypothetical protein